MLSDNELIELMEAGESDRVEFTASVRDLDKFREVICAFANDLPNHKKPGVLFIGVDDKGDCADAPIDSGLLSKLGGLRNDGKTHPFPTMVVGKKTLQDCEIAVVQVEPSDNPPVKVNGRCWIRTGPRRAQASPEEERRLTEKRRWRNVPYDMRPVKGAAVEVDLDLSRFRNEYLPVAVSPEVLAENRRNEIEQMKVLRLATPEGIPTVTAILVLGNRPRDWFPGAYIQFVRYDGGEVTAPIVDQTELNGTLSDQLREVDGLLKRHISIALDTSGKTHAATPDYPVAALQELVRNAVIHRNYENSNAPVRVSWFSDYVKISSPGSVYGEVTKQNFGAPEVTGYRNPSIAEAMKNLGFMERFGMGIPKAREALKENGNPPPKFDVQDTFVFAVIKK